MRDHLDTLVARFRDLDRRTQLLIGGGGSIVVLALAWSLAVGGGDLAVTGTEGPATPAAPPAAAPAPGTTVAQPDGQSAAQPAPTPVAPVDAGGGGGGGGDVITGRTPVQEAWEAAVNDDVPKPRKRVTVADEKAGASDDVKEAAGRLIRWQTAYLKCWHRESEEGDWRTCLEDVSTYGVQVEEMWEQGAGYRALARSRGGVLLTLVRQNNGAECHTIEGSKSCTAW